MTEKQELLLKLFREVDEICKKHNLRYVMAGGTLIGVWRNEGFIPWYDDVDIYMPKSDWDRFVEICKTEAPAHRTVYCSDVDRTYTNSFPRYGATDGCAIHKHQIIGNDKAGEIIDVLTLDPIPDDDREYEKYRTHMMIYSDLLNITAVFGNRWEISAFQYLGWLLQYVFLGKDRTLKKLERIMFSYKEEECSRYAMRWGGCPFLFDKDMMFPVKYGEFEGEKVMIPHRTSDYLIWHYGDEWSYIPAHGERESHDAIDVPGVTYQSLREEYLPRINKGRIRRQMTFRKFYHMLIAKRTHRIQAKRDQIKADVIARDVAARFMRAEQSVGDMVKNREFDRLGEIFDSYYKIQLSAGFIGREDFINIYPFYHPVLIRLEDEVFQAAMLTLIYTERVSKAWRMYQVREKLDHLTPEMTETVEDIRQFRKAASCYEFKEMEEAERIVDRLLEKYPDAPGFLKFKCRFVMERLKGIREEPETEGFLEHCLSVFPDDGYFIKYKGDLLWEKGLRRNALELYEEAREKTTNGIVQLELDKFLKTMKQDAIKECVRLIKDKHKEEAWQLAGQWDRLLPEDEEIHGCFFLTAVAHAHTRTELDELISQIRKCLKNVSEKKMYMDALTLAWRRYGYPGVLAEYRTRLVCTEDVSEMELLAEEIRSFEINKEWQSEVYKVLGDVRRKQGQTREAFELYFKATDCAMHLGVKNELARIFLRDLYHGSRRAAAYGKKGDLTAFYESWLRKYKGQSEIRELLNKVM